jgi:hypothetical protein
MYRAIEDDFNPGSGFVSRTGIRHFFTTVGIRPVVDWGVVEGVNPFIETHHFELLSGGMETRELSGGLGLEFIDGSNGNFNFSDRFERVHEAFDVSGAEVPAGDYDFRDASVSYGTSGGRSLSASMNVGGGGYYNGDRFTLGGGVLGRVGDRMILDLSAEHNRISLPGQESVNAAAYSGRLEWFFSTTLLATALLQYDESGHELVSNLRLKWEHAPLSDMFLVLSERRDTRNDLVLERLVTLKITRLLPF